MNSEVQNFEKLLVKYKLCDLKPEKVQNMAISSGKENLLIILKKTGHYSIIFGLVYKLYYFLKGLGINATLFQTKIILLAITVNAAASLTVGGVYIKKAYFNKKSTNILYNENTVESKKITETPANSIKTYKKNEPNEGILSRREYEIGIAEFQGDSTDALKITSKISENLTGIIGHDKIIFLNNTNRGKVEKILTGSVRRVGKEKFVTVKLVNVEDSKIISILSEKINSDDELESTCRKISESIAKMYLQ